MAFFQNGVTAHRGDSVNYPENTLAAFAAAAALGVDWIELDVRVTADGKLVVIHDSDTGRVADRNMLVEESTLEQLQALDAAFQFRRRHGLSISQCPPARIPELSEVFEPVRRQERTRISVQPKAPIHGPDNRCEIVRQVIVFAAEAGVTGLLGFNDGGLEAMKWVKKLDSRIPVFWDMGSEHTDRDLTEAIAAGFESIVMQEDLVTDERIARIEKAGIVPGVWTVDDREKLLQLLRRGIERFYTNDPSLLLALKRNSANQQAG